MRELEQRRRPIYILSLRIFTIVLLLCAFFLIKAVWGIYQKERETYNGRFRAGQELKDMQEREARLLSDIVRLRSPDGIEASLRSQFDMAKEGEGVIVIVDRGKAEAPEESLDLRTIRSWKRLIPLAPWSLFGQ